MILASVGAYAPLHCMIELLFTRKDVVQCHTRTIEEWKEKSNLLAPFQQTTVLTVNLGSIGLPIVTY